VKRLRHIRGEKAALMLRGKRRTACPEPLAVALSDHYPFVLVNCLSTICFNPLLSLAEEKVWPACSAGR
jgi:hypothetical protein